MSQFTTFFVPVRDGHAEQEALNAFLRGRRVLTVDKACTDGGWAFCVEWIEGAPHAESARPLPKVDYREVLSSEDFALFSRLRNVRRALAERDGVQAYVVMTNEQLAEMVRGKASTSSDLRKIAGIGEARLEKYGAAFIEELNRHPVPETHQGGDVPGKTGTVILKGENV